MIFGGLKNTGVRKMNSNVRPTTFLVRVGNNYAVQTQNRLVKHSNGEFVVFKANQLDKARAMVMAIRKSTGQF